MEPPWNYSEYKNIQIFKWRDFVDSWLTASLSWKCSQRKAFTLFVVEANSSIKYFNDNDETVLQGETQYKHAE